MTNELKAMMASSKLKNSHELVENLRAAAEKLGVLAQAFDPDAIVSERQLLFAHYSAEKAMAEGKNVAKNLSNEVLLRAAATHQVGEAIKRAGAKDPRGFVLLTDASGEKLAELLAGIEASEKKLVLKPDEGKLMGLYDIALKPGRTDGYTLEQLILEKVALANLKS